MPTYTFNNGNFITNGTYTQVYGNGNYTSTSTMVNGMMYTQNVTMLNGMGAGCGDKPCSQGYSLYFPCLKNITRGEDVCFEFYVVDNVMKDVVDLRKVESLTLSLTGNFGCSLGTYTYPSDDDYIKPLQTQEYKPIIDEGFAEREIYNLTAVSIDGEFDEIDETNMEGEVGKFLEGEDVRLIAYDTHSYIFVGWVDLDSELEDDCDDFYLTTNNVLSFKIFKDMNVAAIYRRREEYTINVDNSNAIFSYYDNGDEKPLNNYFHILEGKRIVVKAIPFNCEFLKWDVEGFGNSEYTNPNYILIDLKVFSDIKLKIEGEYDSSDSNYFELNNIGLDFETLAEKQNLDLIEDEENQHHVTEHEISNELIYIEDRDVSELFQEFIPIKYENLYYYGEGQNGVLKFGDSNANGYMQFSNPGIENQTVVEIFCRKIDGEDCSISVTLDDNENQTQELIDGENQLVFMFNNTTFKKMEISTFGEIFPEEKPANCFVDRIVISDIVFIDKGKAALCLPGSITQKFHRGKITVSGAIRIGGQSFGIPCTVAGTVNGNPIINNILY